ncbi:glycoside hydrolase family 76 protein [Streptomyces sp. NBC_00670]|jgi:predicted alpha-1,6-mannanase (GH76 family)|uniref:glycoside hydrolase family 76 protein n=1 Tax=Streptomyces sp. NBC_00670 TaxID=2975804 RepID=UPI002E2F196C|nr:glycoside hydrolase family 76 protein [Streptomyces sp. NBC_00670]
MRYETHAVRATGVVLATAMLTGGFLAGASPASAASTAATFNRADLVRTTNSFLGNYSIDAGDFKTDLSHTSAIHFWEASFDRETLTDASRLTGQWKDRISETYYRYENTHSADRFGNPNCWIGNDSDWNDDYSWATQFALDAYEATGDRHMRDQAKWHLDFFYRDYYDDVHGGGFWRERATKDQKDVPSNGFAIAAAELARYYPDVTVHNNPTNTDKTYLQIAQDTYDWLKKSFLRPDGGLENSFSGRGWDDNLYTYNAGVFLELGANLYDLTKDDTYLADGRKVADFARSHFTTGNKQIIVHEDDVGGNGLYRPDPVGSYEIVFKGIFLRGLYKFITLGGQDQYLGWLGDNAQSSYDHRTNDLPSAAFDQTLTNGRSTGVASGLAAMTYTLAARQRSGRIEAETGQKYGTGRNESATSASGGQLVGSIDKAGAGVEFHNLSATDSLTFRTASANKGAKLSLYVNGRFARKVAFPYTGNWNATFADTTVPVSIPDGATVKLQYDTGDLAANIDSLTLSGSPDAATFYEDAGYTGKAVSLKKGDYTVAQLQAAGLRNDTMTSLQVPAGWTVDVYQDGNFDGTKWTYTADNPNVGPANDRMSSVRIH